MKQAILRFTPPEWGAFIGSVRTGEFDGFSCALAWAPAEG